MQRTIHAPRTDLVTFEPPGRRHRLARRRLAVISGFCGLALASGALQALRENREPEPTTFYVASH